MKLKKELKFIDVYCIASGAMISSGLFVLPGLAHAHAGPAVIFSYFLAGLLAMTGMFSIAELTTAMPKAGGDYFFITRGLGPATGTVAGLLSWFSLSMKSAFALVGMSAFTIIFIDFDIRLISVLFCVFFTFLNIVGVKKAGNFQIILVTSLLIILIMYIIKGTTAVSVENFLPFTPHGWGKILYATGFVFVSYGGILKIASISEEVKNPSVTIPKALMFSLFSIIVFYTLVVFITAGVLDGQILDKSLTPISTAANSFMGKFGTVTLSIAAILAFVSTGNAGIMAASRYPLALSRDNLLPEFFSKIHKKYKTPYMSIILTGLFMILVLFLELNILVKVASTVLILTYILTNFSIIILRESHLQNYRPDFKSPFYPWMQIIGIIGFSFLIFEMGLISFLVSLFFMVSGFLVYWFYGRKRTKQEYALLHLLERLTAKELVTGSLEEELKEVIRYRDDIIKDRFDKLVEDSSMLDINEKIYYKDFFVIAAEKISEKIEVDKNVIYELLLKREKESSTVLSEDLAIPHIIVEGDHRFTLLIARCKDGITFNETYNNVHIVFLIVGTKDERNFHLKTLSAIAQIIQEHDFNKKWRAAKTIETLKDTILLARRRRFNPHIS